MKRTNTAYLHQIPPCSVGKSSLVCNKRKETAAYFLPQVKRQVCLVYTQTQRANKSREFARFIGSASLVGLFAYYDFQLFYAYQCSYLHFGQNSGKFFNSVSSRTFSLVLFLQIMCYPHDFSLIHYELSKIL